jgi:hypothetical protein
VGKRHSNGWPRRCDEGVDRVRQAFKRNRKKSFANAELEMSQKSDHRILWKKLRLNPYELWANH